MPVVHTICVCGKSAASSWAAVDSVSIVECACGIRRVEFIDTDSYTARYTSGNYHAEDRSYDTGHKAHTKRREHDYEVAQSRLNKLQRFDNCMVGKHNGKVNYAPRLLDVGCSNGAFLQAALDRGMNAVGCDLSTDAVHDAYKQFVRTGGIQDCGWQRRTFDIITFNDVLEHIPDPVQALRVAKGLLKRTGILVVDIPDMGSDDAIALGPQFKHVKPHEHIWYFTALQLKDLLEREGFNVLWMDQPIPGKVTAYASPAAVVEEVTILGPPGIGDTMWTFNKLKGIREREDPCRIHYVVCVDGEVKMANRAKDFLLLSKLIDSVEFRPIALPRDVGNTKPAEAVYELFPNDYLEPQGKWLEDWRPELPTDWDLGIGVPECATEQVRARLGKHFDSYIAVHMSSHVWNRITTLPEWTPRHWAELLIRISEDGLKPVLLGAGWDHDYAIDIANEIADLGQEPSKIWINMIGKTPIALAMAYMQEAKLTVGICDGLPMIAAYMGWPTVMLWPTKDVSKTHVQFGINFQTNWVSPAIRKSGSYTPLPVTGDLMNNLYAEIMIRCGWHEERAT